MSVRQKDVLDLELLGEVERRRDGPGLEENRTVYEEARQMPRRGGPALTAEDPELHGKHASGNWPQGALESGLRTVKDP